MGIHGGTQVSAVLAPGVLLTLVAVLGLNEVPEPERAGVKSFDQAETRSVLIEPIPSECYPLRSNYRR